ncbi:hypothetical protein EJB05_57398, partial [Eragrostis curvula]
MGRGRAAARSSARPRDEAISAAAQRRRVHAIHGGGSDLVLVGFIYEGFIIMIQGSNITELAANAILGCLVPQFRPQQ